MPTSMPSDISSNAASAGSSSSDASPRASRKPQPTTSPSSPSPPPYSGSDNCPHDLARPLPDLTFWPEHPMSEGFRDTSRDVRSHNPCHSSDRQAAISA